MSEGIVFLSAVIDCNFAEIKCVHFPYQVLRLWLERKILPESLLRRYMEDIGVPNEETTSGLFLRRPSRSERAVDDPIREMEGMFVDEYGRYGILCIHIYFFI